MLDKMQQLNKYLSLGTWSPGILVGLQYLKKVSENS